MTATMTDRERFLATVNFQETDRPIRYEAIGIDDNTVIRWQAEGWCSGLEHVDFMGEFGMDRFAPGSHPWRLSSGFTCFSGRSTRQVVN